MNSVLGPILIVLDKVLELYGYVVLAAVVLNWLIALNIVNSRNDFVRTVGNIVYQLTEPLLRRIRRVVPMAGGLDLSPMVLLLIIWLIRMYLRQPPF